MDFEFDPHKSESNKDKHKINFEDAQGLWEDSRGCEFRVEVKGEIRIVLIAKHRQRHWTAVYTLRGSKIRLISVRRARVKEIALYDNR